ncbi:MAG: AsmA family protein [Opitutus sp.]
MKKTLRYILLFVVLLVLILYVAGKFFLGSVVKTTVNNAGPRLTQTTVELLDASISPLTGSGTLTGLTVGNPKGWSDGRALYLGKMHFDVKPMSLLRDTIDVNDLTIDQPEFAYETHLISSNIGDLMKNIEAAVGAKSDTQEKPTKEKKLIVRHLKLQNAKVSVGVGGAALPLNLPDLELTDLGVKEGGLTPSQLTFAVIKEVVSSIMGTTTQASVKTGGTLGAAAGDVVKKAGAGLQKFFGGKKAESDPKKAEAEPAK